MTGDAGNMPNMRKKIALEPSMTSAALNVSPSTHGPSPSSRSQVDIIVSKSPQPCR